MSERISSPKTWSVLPAPPEGDHPGWYADPADRSPSARWERYWHGDHWGPEWRRRTASTAPTDPPSHLTGTAASTGLVASLVSVTIPAVPWIVVTGPTTGVVLGLLAVLTTIGCLAAGVGLGCGIVARHEVRGVSAIATSILGGTLSLVTLGLIGMALVAEGISAVL